MLVCMGLGFLLLIMVVCGWLGCLGFLLFFWLFVRIWDELGILWIIYYDGSNEIYYLEDKDIGENRHKYSISHLIVHSNVAPVKPCF